MGPIRPRGQLPVRAALVALLLASACVAADRASNDAAHDRLPEPGAVAAMPPSPSDDSAARVRWLERRAIRFDPARARSSIVDSIVKDVGRRRAVLIGVPFTMSPEQGEITAALVQALHERERFDALVLDAPVWDCATILNPALPPDGETLFASCAFPEWRTEEVRRLFDWIATTHQSGRPLAVFGVDPGCIPSAVATRRPAVVARLDEGGLADFASAGQDGDTRVRRRFRADSLRHERCVSVTPGWRALRETGTTILTTPSTDSSDSYTLSGMSASFLASAVTTSDEETRGRLTLASRAVQSGVLLLRSSQPVRGSAWTSVIDESAAGNLAYVVDTLLAGRKVLVLSHHRGAHGGVATAGSGGPGFLGRTLTALVGRDSTFVVTLIDAPLAMRAQPPERPSEGPTWRDAGGPDARALATSLADSARGVRYLRTRGVPPEPGSAWLFTPARMMPPNSAAPSPRVVVRPVDDFDVILAFTTDRPHRRLPHPPAAPCCPVRSH